MKRGEPRACYREWRAGQGPAADALLLVTFQLPCFWLQGSPSLSLTALYCLAQGKLKLAVTDSELTDGPPGAAACFAHWVEQHRLLVVIPGEELELQPRAVAKPWGRELWYSGVEERGVCQVMTDGRCLPLPWLRAVLPDVSCGDPGLPLLLLKILEPSAEPVTGELYFELHREKREAYIVNRIDPLAWPDGVGYIRYGFSTEKRRQFANEEEFRHTYRQAVAAYETVRRQIDRMGSDEPGAELLAQERHLRAEMNRFIHLRALREGDVLAVPTRLPHGLLHGVRTIEFQTPVYERQILSFTQQVVTQEHWDTAEVLQEMLLEAPAELPFSCLARQEGILVERVIDYPDFEVRRITIEAGAQYQPVPLADYGLAIVAEGELALNGARYEVGQALLLPAGWSARLSAVNPARALVLLLAQPRP